VPFKIDFISFPHLPIHMFTLLIISICVIFRFYIHTTSFLPWSSFLILSCFQVKYLKDMAYRKSSVLLRAHIVFTRLRMTYHFRSAKFMQQISIRNKHKYFVSSERWEL
jgi:hypothetical protein